MTRGEPLRLAHGRSGIRVLMPLHDFPPGVIGGAEMQASRLAGELVRLGHRVSVVSVHRPNRPELESRSGLRVHRLIRPVRLGPIWGISYCATLLAFTDGLVERRGETIDVGLERLRSRASQNHVPLEQLLANVLEDRRDDAPDDTAIAGIRWMT